MEEGRPRIPSLVKVSACGERVGFLTHAVDSLFNRGN